MKRSTPSGFVACLRSLQRSTRAMVGALVMMGVAAPLAAAPTRPGTPVLDFSLLKERPETTVFEPLESVRAQFAKPAASLRLQVCDALGSCYFEAKELKPELHFVVKGALGMHRAKILRGDRVVAEQLFEVDAKTDMAPGGELWRNELRRLAAQLRGFGGVAFIDGQSVRYLSENVRDSRHAVAAARLFETDLVALPNVFLQFQKDNGLVFSALHQDNKWDPFSGAYPGVHLARDTFGEAFTGRSNDGRWVFERTPTEADVESLLVGWVHDVWQATGDDAWMANALPRLEKALMYLHQDPLRWAKEQGLVKRAFTIDVWSLQSFLATRLHPRGNLNRAGWFDGLWIDQGTPMGVAHGDNTAFYEAATLLARMNAHLGLQEQAAAWTQLAERVRENLNKLSWNGSFYRHHVRLVDHPLWKELDANEERQLSMSNPLAITRGLATHAQAVAIVSEYKRRGDRTQGQALAEWSTLDPPFKKGFGPYAPGEGPNGAISPIVAGPLSLGAFGAGLESYGADILRRVLTQQKQHGRLHGFYFPTSRPSGWQEQAFSTVDLRTVANRHLRGDRPSGFIEHPDNDLRSFPVGKQTFLGKPFDVIDPKDNGGRAAVVLWGAGSPGPRETTLSGINKTARSIYFLHSAGNIGRQARVGEYVINYADGTKVRIPLVVGRNISSWWSEADAGEWRIAWRGKNPHVSVITMGVWGWDNKQPDKVIESITVRASGIGRVQLLGITLSSGPVQYDRGEVEGTAADSWAAGAVYIAAVEGLAGVVDRGRVFDHVSVAPRWLAAGETSASVCLRYPSSRGYIAYRWEHHQQERRQKLSFSGSGRRFDFHLLMPGSEKPRHVSLDGRPMRFRMHTIEDSHYVDFSLESTSAGQIEVSY